MKIKNIISVLLCGVFVFGMAALCFFGTKETYSESERRELAKFPEVSWEKISSGAFATEFEKYSTDAFPARDLWRTLKAYTRLGLLGQKENNDIFISDGHLSKIQYPMNPEMLDHAINLLTEVKDKYFPQGNVYFAMVPDKNHAVAHLKMDYDAFEDYMHKGLDFATPIEIRDLLTAEDYYYTDTHWRQNKIADVADRIANAMGVDLPDEYESVQLTTNFNGVYVGQSAMKVEPDEITVLTNDIIKDMKVYTVTDRMTQKEIKDGVYDMTRLEGKDPYETFLSGAQFLMKVKNPHNTSGKRLIVFRDSFGSSITPLLAQGYSEVVLVDLRYIQSSALDAEVLQKYIGFGNENTDILFLYSSLILNDSMALK